MLGKAKQDWIYSQVRHLLNSSFDREFIASNIIIEAHVKGIEHVSRKHIRHKCYDVLRKRKREMEGNQKMVMNNEAINPIEHSEDITSRHDLIEKLVLGRTPFERKLIHARFYLDLPIEQIARDLHMRRQDVQDALRSAVYKMSMELER